MATKKTTKKVLTESMKSEADEEQEKINETINGAFNTGKEQGTRETAQKVEDILKQRAAILFLNKNDDLAKEIREISLSIKENLLNM